ncbi:NAD-dependent epimerase/dehydratase family protein [Bacteroides fragilis]|nr:NAD-dependent epimerase/dehydratase family protein [Bacteroides fragilis]
MMAIFLFIQEDLLNRSSLRQIFIQEDFDMVYHLAANSDIQKGSQDPTVDYDLTFNTTFNVLQCMKEFKVKKFFFASTSAIYGETSDWLKENYGPLLPVSNYGAAKLASEAFISAFSSMYNIQTWIARFPNVVGERFTHGVIYDFIHKLQKNPNVLTVLGDGEQIKPYLYVKDLIGGILFICKNSHEEINIFNLGSTTRTKVKEIAQMVIDEMGLSASIEYTGGTRGWIGDVPEFRYDLTKINTLGWSATYNSNDSVRIAIQKALGK